MNYILLLLTARVLNQIIKRRRLLAGAFFGALYAVFMFFPALSPLYGAAGKVAATVLMVYISFGAKPFFQMLKLSLTLCAVSFLLAGGMIFAAQSFGSSHSLKNGIPYIALSLKTMLISTGVCYIFSSMLYKGIGNRMTANKTVKLRIELRGKSAELNALVDTGCFLKDPLSGRPVIVCNFSAVALLFDSGICRIVGRYAAGNPAKCVELLSEEGHGSGIFRVVPFKTVGTSQGLMLVFKPDRVIGEKNKVMDALIGINTAEIPESEGHAAVMGL